MPYQINAIAGNTQSAIGGFGGDGGPGLSATLNTVGVVAVDEVGNVYIPDSGNAVIREVSAQTGLITIVAGIPPSGCVGTVCKTVNPACPDGVKAVGNGSPSSIHGIVVDGYGNVYFSDTNYQGLWVVYKGGAQVASFINLVDASGVATAGGVYPGYVYHIAGVAAPNANGKGCTDSYNTATTPALPAFDKIIATSALLHNPGHLGLDQAGNVFVQDGGTGVVRVINTQSTDQTFFGVLVHPGFIASIVDCNTILTTTCPSSFSITTPVAAGAALYNKLSGMGVDQYGNVYQVNGSGASYIEGTAAYAGGAPLSRLINLFNGLTATPGFMYSVINGTGTGPGNQPQAALANQDSNIVLRPVAIVADIYGNIYMQDYHWIQTFRIDYNSVISTKMLSAAAQVATPAAPAYCNGTTSTTVGGPTGLITTDKYGDGCPATESKFNSSGFGQTVFDPLEDAIVADQGNNTVRKVSTNTIFPATTTGTTFSQAIQLHFDSTNLPVLGPVQTVTAAIPPNISQIASTVLGAVPYTTSSFQIISGASDFAFSTTYPPTCENYTLTIDTSQECYLNINFTPTLPGARKATIQVTTANGSVYNFGITGTGVGNQFAIDGGTPTVVAAAGLGKSSAVAVGPNGTLYIADSANNQVLALPAGGGTPTKVGTGLSSPMGVAVDSAGNVYISDTGHNAVVEVAAATGTQTTILPVPPPPSGPTGSAVNVRTPAITLKAPQGLAVDGLGQLYIADTGNARVVQVSPWAEYGATAMLEYTGAPALVSPVALAVDAKGYVYVADTGLQQIVQIPPGGGDLVTPSATTVFSPNVPLVAFGKNLSSPSGVAVDAAGDVYISDNTLNSVLEFPAGSGPGSEFFTMNFSGTNFSPAGLALDNSGNLYVADPGDNQILFNNRTSPSLNFGTVPRFTSPATSAQLTFSNIGSKDLVLTTPFAGTPTGNTTAFGVTSTGTTTPACTSGQTVHAGIHCALTASFVPLVNGPASESFTVQGGLGSVTLSGVGENPVVNLVLTSNPAVPVKNTTATITATATQPNPPNNIPTGSVTFTYSINGVITGSPVTVPLTAGTGSSAATFTTPTLLQGRKYVVYATYSGDGLDTLTAAAPYAFYIPGLPVTVTATSASFAYGAKVPTLTGTVTGITDPAVTYTFTTTATSKTPVGTYPITVVFSGGTYLDYGFPPALTVSGAPAIVTETPEPLSVSVTNATTLYGALNYSFIPVLTGVVNNDKFTETYASNGQNPVQTSTLPVGTYSVAPIIVGAGNTNIANYAVTPVSGTLTVSPAPSAIFIAQAATASLPGNISGDTITINVGTAVSQGAGVPTGTVTITDVFTPITTGAPGPTVTSTIGPLALVAGGTTYTPTSSVLGTHLYTFAYSGDSNFQASATLTASKLIIDNADFTISATTSPIQIVPGIIPGGNAAIAGEQAATPEITTITIAPILAFTGVVTVTCTNPASYFSCSLTPPTVTVPSPGTASQTTVLAISVPATLPLGFTSQLRGSPTKTVLAFLPLGLLAFIPLCMRSKRRISKALWMFLAAAAMTTGISGCGPNLVQFYTPVPAGPQTIVVTATGVSPTNGASLTRQFTVNLNVQ